MATLYVHIGMEKTGTTSLQQFFVRNRRVLREHGAVYPKFDQRYEWISKNVNAFWLMPAEKDENVREACFQKINKLARKFDKILISAETLWNDQAYKPEFWEYLRAHVDPSVEIKSVAYLRRQDLYIYSRWEQSVKSQISTGKNTYTFKEYIENGHYLHNRLDYGAYLQGIEPVIGRENMLVRVFEPGRFKDGSLTADFMELLGLELDESYSSPEERRNITIRGGVLETKRLLNYLVEFKEHENRILPYLISAQDQLAGTEIMRECGVFTEQERDAFLEQYRESNAWVARELFGREDGKLFSEPVPPAMDEEKEIPYTTQEIAGVCGRMILQLMQEKRELKERIRQLEEERN